MSKMHATLKHNDTPSEMTRWVNYILPMSHVANSKVRRVAAKQWPIKTINFAFIAVRIGKLTVFTPLNTSLWINARSQRSSKPLKYLLEISISQNFMRKVSLSNDISSDISRIYRTIFQKHKWKSAISKIRWSKNSRGK